MRMKSGEELPAELARVRHGLTEWREQRRGRERIPEALWGEAARAAREYGVNRVSQALGLEYCQLKRRAGAGRADKEGLPVFVELKHAQTEAGLTCVVELEKGNGARMRICVREATVVDWGKLKEAFLGA